MWTEKHRPKSIEEMVGNEEGRVKYVIADASEADTLPLGSGRPGWLTLSTSRSYRSFTTIEYAQMKNPVRKPSASWRAETAGGLET